MKRHKTSSVFILSLAVLSGSFLFSGCRDTEDTTKKKRISKSSSSATTEDPDEDASDPKEPDRDTDGIQLPTSSDSDDDFSSQSDPSPTTSIDTTLNNGHSISESGERYREIRRSTDVILSEDEALEYLQDSVTLQNDILDFRLLTSTPEDDPYAYQWYRFCVYCNDLRVENATFDVVCFYDGTIVEGRMEILTCNFKHDTNIITPDEALEAYNQSSSNTKSYTYKEMCYFFSGKEREMVPLVYVYRHESKDPTKAYTLLLDAETGEAVGYWPDAIT